jgi:peroxiredoxin
MTLILFGMTLPWLLVGLGCWLTYQLARQNGRILLRLEELEEQFGLLRGLLALESSPAPEADPSPLSPGRRGVGGDGAVASGNGHAVKPARGKANLGLAASRINRNGLKAGTPAPGFRLPRLDGGELALEDYRGQRVLLVFSDPDCGPCEELAPHLEEFHRHSGDIHVLMISRRDADVNRRKVKAFGLTFPVVLQRHWQISLLYGIFATPVAYLIDKQGIIAADVASGADAIQALISGAAEAGKEVVAMRG